MSSLVQTTVTKARPGRRHDAIALGVEAAKLLERHGAPDSRMLAADVAGEMTGTHAFSTEFDSGEAWGAFNDSLAADAELEALMGRVEGAESPVDVLSMSMATDIPLGRAGTRDQGRVLEAYISRAVPGRFVAAVELATTVFDFVEAHGASGCRLMQLTSAGMLTDCLVATWELETMKELGRLGDAYGSEPAGQHIVEILTGADGPVTPVTSGIYRVIEM